MWPENVTIRPHEDVTMLLPGGLIGENEKVGSIIIAPDSAKISFQQSDKPDGSFVTITLHLLRGSPVRIARTTQAIILSKTSKPIMLTMVKM